MTRIEIAKQLFTMRKSANLTQNELANRCGFSAARVSDREHCKYGTTIDTLQRWASACGYTMRITFTKDN